MSREQAAIRSHYIKQRGDLKNAILRYLKWCIKRNDSDCNLTDVAVTWNKRYIQKRVNDKIYKRKITGFKPDFCHGVVKYNKVEMRLLVF